MGPGAFCNACTICIRFVRPRPTREHHVLDTEKEQSRRFRGARIGFAHDINDDWDLLVQHTAQTLEAEGSFLAEPDIAEDASARFAPEYNRDEFGLTTWTLNGRLSQLELIYTGGLLDREVDSLIDYTHYNNGGGYITYYLCSGNIYDLTDPNHCFDPRKQYIEDTVNRRVTHEFRVHTDPARRWRVLGGVYVNDVETNHIGDFNYYSTNRAMGEHANNYYNDNRGDGCMVGNIAVPTDGVNTMGPRGPLTTFFNDYTRTEWEAAGFGEIAFDITDAVTVSFSARSHDLEAALQGASNFSFGCRYGIGGFGNSHHTEDGRCNSHAFSNDVTARLRTLGRYNETGDDSVILDATSPDGARNMFRGGGADGQPDQLRGGREELPARHGTDAHQSPIARHRGARRQRTAHGARARSPLPP